MGIESKPALRAGLTTFRKLCSSTSKAAYMLDIDTSEVSDVEPAPAVTTFPTVFSARDTRPEMGATIRVCPRSSSADSSMALAASRLAAASLRSEEHTSELQSLMRISYAVFCLKKIKISNEKLSGKH